MKAVITACILMMGAIVTSCSKDESPDNNVVVAQGDPVNVTVTINQASSGNSRASTTTEGALDVETDITDENLIVFVFDATPGGAGMLESTHAVKFVTSGTASVTSNAFAITTGSKYFYIFANANKALNHVKDSYYSGETYLRSLAPANSTHDEFKAQALEKLSVAALSAVNTTTTPAQGEFLIGTLWADDPDNLHTILNTTTTQNITGLKVGRLVSKISFIDADFTEQFKAASIAGGKLDGTWPDVKWRIFNQPDEMFVVGNWKNFFPGNTGSQVMTPFFTRANNLLWDVTSLADATPVIVPGSLTNWSDKDIAYTLENTHEFPKKGNTTAVQFKAQFQPTTLLNGVGTPATDGTFWAVLSGNSYEFYNANPSIADAVRYERGYVYYHAYITDNNETATNYGPTRYAVLRNHQYGLEIKSIGALGDNDDNPFNKPGTNDPTEPGGTDDPKPEDPIDKDIPNITIAISVLPWNYIGQSINW